jgi:hypothetical protein
MIMNKTILVYDTEGVYFNLLKDRVKGGFEFVAYAGQQQSKGFDAIAFFLHDTIEALDISRLYDRSKPFILASYNSRSGITHENNMYVINMSLPVTEILNMLNAIFNELKELLK